MQYDDVITNPRLRTDAILKIVFWLYLGAILTDKRQKLKIYNDVLGRLYGCYTIKTEKNKKEGDNTLQYIARMSM